MATCTAKAATSTKPLFYFYVLFSARYPSKLGSARFFVAGGP